MQIIPAIDLIGGKCVRLTQGAYESKKVYNESPLEVAKSFEGVGVERLHLVDLDGAKSNGIVNWKVLESIASKTSLKIDFGGGIKKEEDLKIAFDSGANQVTGGSIAVKDRTLFESWINKFGSDRIILGADAKEGKIAVSGWQELTTLDLTDFIDRYIHAGIEYVICTDISKDGMLAGPATILYTNLLMKFPKLKLIASGGVSGMDDVLELSQLPLEGAIVGKAIYENRITLKQIENYVNQTNNTLS